MEKKLLILSEQRYNSSQMILFIAGAMSFFKDLKWLPPLVHSFNFLAINLDIKNFYNKVEEISEIVSPKLKNGYEFSRLEASYGFSTVWLQSILGIISGIIRMFDPEKISKFINEKVINFINDNIKKCNYLPNCTASTIEDIKYFLSVGVFTLGLLNVIFGQDSAKTYAVYKMQNFDPILEDLPKPISEEIPQTIPSQEDIKKDIEEDFEDIIEDNNLAAVLSLDESLCYN